MILPTTKFAYNNYVNCSTRKSQFEICDHSSHDGQIEVVNCSLRDVVRSLVREK